MILYLSVICLFAYMLSITFPAIYLKEKQNTLEQNEILLHESNEVGQFPILAIAMFIVPVLIYYLSENMLLSSFCFVLSVVAYTDLSARWVPDLTIYLLLVLAMLALRTADLIMSLWSVLFYVMPAALFSAYGYFIKKEKWIASGDYYIFPAIGLMLTPDYAAGIMLINLLVVLLLSRWVQKIPLVSVAYFTFTGCQTCIFLGFI